jgi:hypothetical protein
MNNRRLNNIALNGMFRWDIVFIFRFTFCPADTALATIIDPAVQKIGPWCQDDR